MAHKKSRPTARKGGGSSPKNKLPSTTKRRTATKLPSSSLKKKSAVTTARKKKIQTVNDPMIVSSDSEDAPQPELAGSDEMPIDTEHPVEQEVPSDQPSDPTPSNEEDETEHEDEEKSSEVETPTGPTAEHVAAEPPHGTGGVAVVVPENEPNRNGVKDRRQSAVEGRGNQHKVRANPHQVVFVNGIKNPRERFSNFDVREELEKFFPGKAWRAHFIRNGGLRISGFKFQEEVNFVTSINWNTYFGEKGAPFGGCTHPVKARISVPREVLARDVCIFVEGKLSTELIAQRLIQDQYHNVEIISPGKVIKPEWHRPVRLRMGSIEDHNRIILEGVRFGGVEDFAVSWCTRDRETRCYNCQSRGTSHMAGNCPRATVCPRCSGGHSLKECTASAAELKCPACSQRHPVWSEKCPVALRRMMAESDRIGVPYPPFWAGVRLSSLRQSQRAVKILSQYSTQVSVQQGTFAQRAGGGGASFASSGRKWVDNTQQVEVAEPCMGGGSYRDGGMANKPSRNDSTEKRIEENVSHKVVKQGLSIFRRFLKTLAAEVDKELKVRGKTKSNGLPEGAVGKGSDNKENSDDADMEDSADDPEKKSESELSDPQDLLQSTTDSTLNMVAVLMRSLLKILGPQAIDEDDDELEEGEISKMFSELSFKC